MRLNRSYHLGQELGRGSFGQVRMAKAKKTKCVVAVKCVTRRRRDRVKMEHRTWTQLGRHEHCVELIETFLDRHHCFFVMEKCECTILDKLVKSSNSTELDLSQHFREMLLGVAYVHDFHIVHRDIKLENFLSGGASGDVVKLADFGFATFVHKDKKLKDQVGTLEYTSPEMIQQQGYTEKTDIWSMGVLSYVMLFGYFPFSAANKRDYKAMMNNIISEHFQPSYKRPAAKKQLEPPSNDAVRFAQNLLVRDDEQRPTAHEALEDPFVTIDEVPEMRNFSKQSTQSTKDMVEVIVLARQATKEVNKLEDPTVQKCIKQLTRELKAGNEGIHALRRSFTAPTNEDEGMRPRISVRSNSASRVPDGKTREFVDGDTDTTSADDQVRARSRKSTSRLSGKTVVSASMFASDPGFKSPSMFASDPGSKGPSLLEESFNAADGAREVPFKDELSKELSRSRSASKDRVSDLGQLPLEVQASDRMHAYVPPSHSVHNMMMARPPISSI